MTRVLVVDNHDSFVHTLVGYLRELGADVTLIEADATDAAQLEGLLPAFDALLLSPGPGTPADAGVSIDAVRLAARISMAAKACAFWASRTSLSGCAAMPSRAC